MYGKRIRIVARREFSFMIVCAKCTGAVKLAQIVRNKRVLLLIDWKTLISSYVANEIYAEFLIVADTDTEKHRSVYA